MSSPTKARKLAMGLKFYSEDSSSSSSSEAYDVSQWNTVFKKILKRNLNGFEFKEIPNLWK